MAGCEQRQAIANVAGMEPTATAFEGHQEAIEIAPYRDQHELQRTLSQRFAYMQRHQSGRGAHQGNTRLLTQLGKCLAHARLQLDAQNPQYHYLYLAEAA